MRRPCGDQRVGVGDELGERLGRLFARRLERVDAKIERRARRQRGAFFGTLFPEGAGEMRFEPFRIVAGNPGRRTVETGGVEPRAFGIGERRRCEPAAIGKPCDRGGVQLAFEPQHAEQHRARRVIGHDECSRRLSP